MLLLLAATFAVTAPAIAEEENDNRYIVQFRDFSGAAAAIRGAGGVTAIELPNHNAIAAYLPEQALHGLQNNPNVLLIERDARRYLMSQTTPYGIPMVQADLLAATNAGACTVCIIDSGYQVAHEDLQSSKVTGTNDSGTGNWYEDSCGHGTHVAGTVAALNNSLGVVGVVGNGSVNIHIEKVFNGTDCKWAYSSGLVQALDRCRAKVSGTSQKLIVSMSLGGSLSSTTENNAFANAYNAGVLSIAAAGNDGSTRKSYPASYSSVISVGALDSNKQIASFSQKNDAVELAAPGVSVLSTVPWKSSSFSVGGAAYMAGNLDGSARKDVTGTMVTGGLCDSQSSTWSGRIVLCERGVISFADKVNNVRLSGGIGAVIYNNVSGGFAGTLNGTSTIPGVSISKEDGDIAKTKAGSSSTIVNSTGTGSGYEAWDGTSMATPHVAGVAALVWSNHPSKTNAEIRSALQQSAEDLGSAGKDNSYGYGLVRAKAAVDLLAGSGGGGTTPPPAGITLSVSKSKVKGQNYSNLSWSGASGSVDVFVGTTRLTTTSATSYSHGPLSKGSYTYKVCNAGTTTCSNSVTVSH
jgi:serine protease